MKAEAPHPLLWVASGLVLAYLVIPSVIVIVMSLSGSLFFEFPPRVFSTRWYQAYWASPQWLQASLRSLKVAGLVTVVATVIGTMASVALVRLTFAGKALLKALIISPIIVPTIVLSIGVYGVYASWRMIGTTLGLVLAHTVLALPFVVLNVTAVLYKLDRSVERAARIHGASPLSAFRLVTLPLIWPGIASGAIFAFLSSFDEIVIAMFISGADPTLPKLMFDGIRYEMNPVVAAVSTQLIVISSLALLGFAWLRRRADRLRGG